MPPKAVAHGAFHESKKSGEGWNRFALGERMRAMTKHNRMFPISVRSITARRGALVGALLTGVLGGCAVAHDDHDIENTQNLQQALLGGLECEISDSAMTGIGDPPLPTPDSCSSVIIGSNAIITARVIESSVPEARRRFKWFINGEIARTNSVYTLRSDAGCSASECSIRVSRSVCSPTQLFTFEVKISDRNDPSEAVLDTATVTATLEGSDACNPGGGGGGGGGGLDEGGCELVPAEEICHNFPASPIVLDLGEVGYDLTNTTAGVRFDIDADGALEQVSWTARGSDDAFLALDRNGNGQIDDAGELFGTATKLADGTTSAHGYIPLAELDLEANGGNGNGYIDEADRRFDTLLLWTDRNHDGRSSSNELRHLQDSGIFAIALHPDESDVIDEHGNRLAYVSPAYAWRRNRIQRIRTTDIFFWFRELAPQK